MGGAVTTWPYPAELGYVSLTDPEGRYAADVRSAAPRPATLDGFGIAFRKPEPPFDLVVWDLVRGAEHRRVRLADDVGSVYPYFTPDGRGVVVRDDQWDIATGRKLQASKALSPVGTLAPDGQRSAVATNGNMEVWDVSTQKKLSSHPLGVHKSYEVRWSPDGRRLAAATGTTALVWDVSGKAK